MLTKLKEKVQKMLTAEAKAAHRIGLAPNAISIIGIILAFLSATAYAEWQINNFYLLVATVLLLLSGFCDALDGAIARLYEEATVFGGFLDSLFDRYADALVYAGIIISGLCDVLWGLAALTGSLLVSYSRARAEAANIKIESVGLAERAERMIILAIASLVAFFWQPQTAINAGIIMLAILSNLTVLQRSVYVYRKQKKTGN
ncbi:CDP-alcohol phosphatidyltransferase family protein [Candidatus Bathyarchaeota archaeon]|nr:CDP-alcohol phosphatidyltransferase family protein [Candidatus Bathyarchaeota archaeon]